MSVKDIVKHGMTKKYDDMRTSVFTTLGEKRVEKEKDVYREVASGSLVNESFGAAVNKAQRKRLAAIKKARKAKEKGMSKDDIAKKFDLLPADLDKLFDDVPLNSRGHRVMTY